jgi:hypothetical protein
MFFEHRVKLLLDCGELVLAVVIAACFALK